MKVLLLGEGGSASAALDAIRRRHEVVGYVVPKRRGLRARLGNLLHRRIEIGREDLATFDPASYGAEIVCIAGFPWLLPESALTVPAINAHPSLLPRHRGPLPFFWIYHEDDRETGVTVHCVTPELDAGDIHARISFPLERGLPVDDLAVRVRAEGARLLVETLDAIARGSAETVPQDPVTVTQAPRVPDRSRTIDWETWPAERVWHFLHGLLPHYREDVGATYRRVSAFDEESHSKRPGSIDRDRDRFTLYCRDGRVFLHE
ncbi:MAG: hypothetical protein KY459_08945 [Acidobacteria bacterium]|nr:hypothetical protein [Acidobacteriota bacterium]